MRFCSRSTHVNFHSCQEREEEQEETYLVDVRQHSSSSDGRTNEGIKFLISSNGELQVTRSDTLDTKILRGVTYNTSSVREAGEREAKTNQRVQELQQSSIRE